METHLMIAMALILKDCKQFQEQEYDYAPPEDVQEYQRSLDLASSHISDEDASYSTDYNTSVLPLHLNTSSSASTIST